MKGALWNVCKYVFIIPFKAGVCPDGSRAVMESDLGSEGVCSLKLARCSDIRLIVSCHYQHETKVCDLSFCSVTALKTDGKPQGSSPSTLFEGFAGGGMAW